MWQLALGVAFCFQVLLTSHPAKLVVAQSFHWAQVTPAGSFDICPVDCESWHARHFLACRVHSGFPVLGAGWNLLARKKCILLVLCLPAMFWLMVYSSIPHSQATSGLSRFLNRGQVSAVPPPGASGAFTWHYASSDHKHGDANQVCYRPVLATAFYSLFFHCSDRAGQSVSYSQGASLRVKPLISSNWKTSWDVGARDI